MLTIEEEAVLYVMDLLDSCNAHWMLTGSLASNMFGVARGTQDADFVVEIDDESLRVFRTALDDRFIFDGQMKFETMTMSTRYDMTLRETGFRIELFFLAADAFAQNRFERRIQRDYCGRLAWVPTAEDVVVQKVRWGRKKDLPDATNVIAVTGKTLDWSYIEAWCAQHGTLDTLREVREAAEELMGDDL